MRQYTIITGLILELLSFLNLISILLEQTNNREKEIDKIPETVN